MKVSKKVIYVLRFESIFQRIELSTKLKQLNYHKETKDMATDYNNPFRIGVPEAPWFSIVRPVSVLSSGEALLLGAAKGSLVNDFTKEIYVLEINHSAPSVPQSCANFGCLQLHRIGLPIFCLMTFYSSIFFAVGHVGFACMFIYLGDPIG